MKLDFSKSYGVIYGHPTARYEQDGQFFDASGTSMSETEISPQAEPQPTTPVMTPKKFLSGRELLLEMLKDGPADKDVIFQQAAAHGLDIAEVRDEFIRLGGQATRRKGGKTTWSIAEQKAA